MSYILDALRKADADRARDPARGIHAQAVGTPPVEPSRRWWPVALVAIAVAGVIAGMLLAHDGADAPQPADTAERAVAAPPAMAVMPPAAPRLPQAPVVAPAKQAALPASAAFPAAPSASAAAGATKAAPPDRVLAISELPPDIQRELPRLPLAGGVYSQNTAQRMLIVNGQVAVEGTEVAPGLVLEQIQPKAAVMRFRGWRYTVPY